MMGHNDLGLNPRNYMLEEEVENDILAQQ